MCIRDRLIGSPYASLVVRYDDAIAGLTHMGFHHLSTIGELTVEQPKLGDNVVAIDNHITILLGLGINLNRTPE